MKLGDPKIQKWLGQEVETEAVVLIRTNSQGVNSLVIYNEPSSPLGVRFISINKESPGITWKEFLSQHPWTQEMIQIPKGLNPQEQVDWMKANSDRSQ